MKNNKLIVILLLSIIILQNIGLFISKQEKLKSTIRDTEMYINGAASEINDLINLNINDKSSSEDIERFNQIISFCKYDMFLGDKSLDGYRINVDSELNDFSNRLESIASGSPLVANSTSDMADTTRVYVNTSDGKWYYYNVL